tara:strand:+ start:216 stop:908 length:693 start_codon:yes stop_codon:yes gene_type:complete
MDPFSAAASLVTGLVGGISAGRQAKRARKLAEKSEQRVKNLENNRQAIINPYENTTDLSGLAKDVSGMASNPYANLSVATGAAEMQAEETDIALANTLDTLRSTGSSAGGATALAQAALQSKKGIAANIQEQEVNNEKLKAQGESTLEAIKMSEAQRMQMVNMSEAQRMQSADAQGKAYVFETKEQRDVDQLARASAQGQQARAQQIQSNTDVAGALGGALGGVVSSLGY